MKYTIFIAQVAKDDLDDLPRNLVDTITRRIDAMKEGLPAGVKPLSKFQFGCRLRVGHYRVLFDVRGAEIIIQRVRHRRHAYATQTGRKKRKGQH